MQQNCQNPAWPGNKPAISVLLSLLLTACGDKQPAAASPAATAINSEVTCGTDGALRTALFGAIETEIDWSGSEVDCDSMQRPDGAGIRLRFSGSVDQKRLHLIVAMPELEAGVRGTELASNVTVSVDGTGRFFSTANLNTCWTDVETHDLIEDRRYAVAGRLFCVAPLGELNGGAAITIPELSFAGIVDWGAK